MTLRIGVLGLAAACLWGGNIQRFERAGNVFTVELSDGKAQMEWVSASTFHFCRAWSGRPCALDPINPEAVGLKVEDSKEALRFTTRYITVTWEKAGGRVNVSSFGGQAVNAGREIGFAGSGAELRCGLAEGERFYGLGVLPEAGLDLRGMKVEARRPLLISSAGYGEFYPEAAGVEFDLSRDAERQVHLRGSGRMEYFFHYGPTPKEILEEHRATVEAIEALGAKHFEVLDAGALPRSVKAVAGGPEGLRMALRRLAQQSFSGVLLPALDMAPYLAGPEPVASRARELASVLPLVIGPHFEMSPLRRSLLPYLVSYAQEARDRGFPIFRPLPMQYPEDREAVRQMDEFMLGDELLVAPLLDAVPRRTVYLPMGSWTELKSDRRYRGRQTIEAEGPEVPIFVKTGSVVPLACANRPLELHYFANLGGEFFLTEEDLGDITQVHAAPAGDILRLEIESLKGREYEWVIHDLPRCKAVRWGERELAWTYEAAARRLRIQTRVEAKQDQIVNVEF